jgi:extracellular factor (EF) 3-hydroxypalmitic acid methyl ester biosynthesis protein
MNLVQNGNSSKNGSASPSAQAKQTAAQAQHDTPTENAAETQIEYETKEGVVVGGLPLHITRYAAVFELYSPIVTPQFSEALSNFKIVLRKRTLYNGHAVVHNVLNTGLKTVCEVTLSEKGWTDVTLDIQSFTSAEIAANFHQFIQEWQKFHLVSREYKVAVANLQTFLADLQIWLEQIELEVRTAPEAKRRQLETGIIESLREPVLVALKSLFEQFEEVSFKVPPALRPAHRAFGRRQLHPYFLCAPFFRRTFTKPLGFAGDYEMMSMIIRNQVEGESIFGKLVNTYLLDHGPCRAVRNRAKFLTIKISDEVSRVAREGRDAHIFCIACGPAWEAVDFIANHPLADKAHFNLLDFNEETLRYTSQKMDEVRQQHHRKTQVKLIKNSVQNLLRARGRNPAANGAYDLIYCSGLYDYLSDSVCRALNSHLYDLLAPGGLMVVGNFATCTPGQNLMEHLMEWFLIYRDDRQLAGLAPEQATREDCVVRSEPSGANFFLEIRKP